MPCPDCNRTQTGERPALPSDFIIDVDRTNVIPLPVRRMTEVDLGEPADLMKMSARELIDSIEAQGFEGEAGPLLNSMEWIELKRRLNKP